MLSAGNEEKSNRNKVSQRGFPSRRDEFRPCGYISPSSNSPRYHSSGFNNTISLVCILIQRSVMNQALRFFILIGISVVLLTNVLAQSRDWFGVCIRNCAQCKQMYGPWFAGEKCANACIKFKGKLTPDCVDTESVAPFLKRLEDSD